jgi:hypothetical protein
MKRSGISEQFDQRYESFIGDMEENTISTLLGQFSEEIWEGLKDKGILTSVEHSPFDSLGGSINIHLSTMPDDHYLKLWYSPKKPGYLLSFFHRIAGTLERQIPDTFNADGIVTFSDLDHFEGWLLDMLAKEFYNMKNKKIHK